MFWTERDFCIISDCKNWFNKKLKTYEQIELTQQIHSIHLRNPLRKNVIPSLVCIPFSLVSICKYWIYVIDEMGVFSAKRSIFDVWQGSEYASWWHIKTWKIEKCVFLWKSSIFIVLSIIQHQSKTKKLPHTAFETFINNNSWYKTLKLSLWVLWIEDAWNIHKSIFY